jgi:glycosyltransferase A (GT-A) superfamily protein (DUF2064 family)
MVFIPAEDGGYVLVGARCGGLETVCFDDVALVSAQVMAQTWQQLMARGWQMHHDWREMPALWDVDTPEDFQRTLLLDRYAINASDSIAGA